VLSKINRETPPLADSGQFVALQDIPDQDNLADQRAAVGLPALAQAAPGGPDWRRYVRGPAGPDVRPARVTATTGDVRNANALLEPGDGVTVLNRPKPVPPPTWPSGTTAGASSTHAPNGGDSGTPTGYDASHAVDGDPSTLPNWEIWPSCASSALPFTSTRAA
jgi:hypothetical protein